MHHLGHYGVGLSLYAPVGCALVVVGLADLALAGGVVLLSLSMLPDVDSKTERMRHRGPTHSLVFAGLVGLVVGALAGVLAPLLFGLPPLVLAGFGAFVGTLAIVAHLVADVLTPMGVRPFWPLSARHYTLDLTLASNSRANYLLFALGSALATGAWLLGSTLA